ncbi:YIP1 family protein [Salipiger abyssi]|uniref:Yip1 domain-containing protein n=1 Tax=Salipiger abyssi TaxID=1250539 RepID=A0A1P8UPK2_9RHOB|nr:YIP1 family protein [Salipiger abyssi]APZ51334.1 Yip1 domain-containing protein [Salipiger abyssi]MBN9887291.1 YIP1 family protein [Salipiger abyssi]
MSLSREILATYRGPGAVVARLLSQGPREDRALVLVMAACALFFVAQMPALARQAHMQEIELNPLLGGALLAWLVIAPLLFYLLAFVAQIVAKLFGGKGSGYGARLALFWALLAASPLVLLNGLVAGFMGAGPQLTLVGLIWFAVFLWFWLSGMRAAQKAPAA